MKNLLPIAVFFGVFMLSSSLNAQSFNAGVLAGINASQVSGDNYAGFNKAGLLLGLFTNIDVSEKMNLQFEINYSEKGSRKNPKTSEGEHDFFLLRLNYVEIPVMARIKYKHFTFEGGLYYGQLINEHLEDENGDITISSNRNQFHDYDTGFLVGINYHFTKNIIMNWRYSNSMLPIREYDSGASYLYFDSGSYNSYLSFNLRYTFIGGGE